MKANVCNTDRILRVVVGVILITLAATGMFVPLSWIGVLVLITGIAKFCPAYRFLGLSTCPRERK